MQGDGSFCMHGRDFRPFISDIPHAAQVQELLLLCLTSLSADPWYSRLSSRSILVHAHKGCTRLVPGQPLTYSRACRSHPSASQDMRLHCSI